LRLRCKSAYRGSLRVTLMAINNPGKKTDSESVELLQRLFYRIPELPFDTISP
jgi:hypothetical protein